MSGDYSAVTETPGVRLTREALAMMQTRYRFAAELARGKDVLEVACGAGQGLGLLAASARRVVGGDFTASLVRSARSHYGPRMGLLVLDASVLPFAAESFDLVLVYEAIYYFPDAARCIAECRRILRSGGRIVVCSVNRRWQGFNPSPHSVRYYDAEELLALLRGAGFEPSLFGAYRDAAASPLSRLVAAVRTAAVRLRLMPRTMKGKELLKRLFYGRLEPMPPELSPGSEYGRPEPLTDLADPRLKVLYAVGARSNASA